MLYLLDLEVPNICECYYRHGVITPPDYVVFTRFGGTKHLRSAIIDMGSLHLGLCCIYSIWRYQTFASAIIDMGHDTA